PPLPEGKSKAQETKDYHPPNGYQCFTVSHNLLLARLQSCFYDGSGSRRPLLASRPLRTVHATFTAYGSSIGQRIDQDTRLPHWPWGQPGRYHGRAGYRGEIGGGCSTTNSLCDRADIFASQPTPVG